MTGQRDAARRSVAVCEMATEHCMSNQTSEGLTTPSPRGGRAGVVLRLQRIIVNHTVSKHGMSFACNPCYSPKGHQEVLARRI